MCKVRHAEDSTSNQFLNLKETAEAWRHQSIQQHPPLTAQAIKMPPSRIQGCWTSFEKSSQLQGPFEKPMTAAGALQTSIRSSCDGHRTFKRFYDLQVHSRILCNRMSHNYCTTVRKKLTFPRQIRQVGQAEAVGRLPILINISCCIRKSPTNRRRRPQNSWKNLLGDSDGRQVQPDQKLYTCEICQKARPGSYLSISGQLRSTMALKILQAFRLILQYCEASSFASLGRACSSHLGQTQKDRTVIKTYKIFYSSLVQQSGNRVGGKVSAQRKTTAHLSL